MKELIDDLGILDGAEGVTLPNLKGIQIPARAASFDIESYGCLAMNFSDSEIVASVLQNDGFDTTSDINRSGCCVS